MEDKQPSPTDFARHLKLKPTRREKDAGLASGASLVREVADTGETWCVITHRGSKHYIPKSEL